MFVLSYSEVSYDAGGRSVADVSPRKLRFHNINHLLQCGVTVQYLENIRFASSTTEGMSEDERDASLKVLCKVWHPWMSGDITGNVNDDGSGEDTTERKSAAAIILCWRKAAYLAHWFDITLSTNDGDDYQFIVSCGRIEET